MGVHCYWICAKDLLIDHEDLQWCRYVSMLINRYDWNSESFWESLVLDEEWCKRISRAELVHVEKLRSDRLTFCALSAHRSLNQCKDDQISIKASFCSTDVDHDNLFQQRFSRDWFVEEVRVPLTTKLDEEKKRKKRERWRRTHGQSRFLKQFIHRRWK